MTIRLYHFISVDGAPVCCASNTPVDLFQSTGTQSANAFVHDRRNCPVSLRHFLGTHLNFRFRAMYWFVADGEHFSRLRNFYSVLMHRFAQNRNPDLDSRLCHKNALGRHSCTSSSGMSLPSFLLFLS